MCLIRQRLLLGFWCGIIRQRHPEIPTHGTAVTEGGGEHCDGPWNGPVAGLISLDRAAFGSEKTTKPRRTEAKRFPDLAEFERCHRAI